MFPIRDHNPSGRIPFVTYILLVLNVGIFLSYQGIAGNPQALARFYYDWGMIPNNITQGYDYHTLISSMFLHGGWMHLAGNMLFLWIFGDNIEDAFGHIGFLVFYLVAGIIASATQIAWDVGSGIPNVGASGAIAGVLGAYLLLYPRAKVDILLILIVFFRVFTIPAWIMLGLWFCFQIYNGVNTTTVGGGVAYWAHAGGFAAGVILALPYWIRRGAARFWASSDGHPPHPDAQYTLTATRIPRVRRK